MSQTATALAEFVEDPPRLQEHAADALLLNIDGYEGPIDVLLELARHQKVDLTKISILQLVRQYLGFIERAQALDLELAAEYLVMAAWLAYLKSRLLLPRTPEDEAQPGAAEMAEALQFQLRRLEAMKKAAQDLMTLPRLGQSVFARGAPEGLSVRTQARWTLSLYDLLKSYGEMQQRKEGATYDLPSFNLMTAEDAVARLTRMLGRLPRQGLHSVWTTLESLLPEGIKDKLYARSTLASMLTAGLELVRQGKLEIRQDANFRPIYIRGVGE
ncbi:MAG: segregation/condensation protein A [Alphaproteobacteria bacterium]|nr:segregation/condensation protein A [Alphaproteobacteria bacterium]